MLTSMRRVGGFTADEQLKRLYDNMRAGYKLYIKLDELTSLTDLSARAADYEAIMKQDQERSPGGKNLATKPAVAAATYNREECCWRCKQRGHTRMDCKRPPKRFCSRCGKDGVLTRDCHPSPGNAERARSEAAAVRPPSPKSE